MPVRCKLLNDKYRIIGPDGKIETNKAGTFVDGGGHATNDDCLKQAAAINITLSLYEADKGTDLPIVESKASIIICEGELPLAITSNVEEVQRFKKDMIRVGLYVHPIHGWKMNVTPERLQRWLTNFHAMRTNGVDIEVPLDHSLSAEKNLGYVVDAMIERDSHNVLTLFGIIEVKGQNAIDIIRRNKNVSVWIAQNYKDGQENFYGEVIKHCAVVQQPVVPGQEDFVPIAASERGVEERIPIYYQRSNTMTKEQFEKLCKLFGLEKDIKEEDIFKVLTAQEIERVSKLETLQKENLALKSAASSEEHKASAMDLNTLELVGSTMNDKIDLLVEKGNIIPAVAKKLSIVLAGIQGSRHELTLSLGKDATPSIASGVIEALQDNDPVKMQEQTKSQVLNREIPGNEDSKEAAKEGEDGMALGAGVEATSKK